MEILKKNILSISSLEVADMVEKEHSKLLRDIRNYIKYFNEANFGFVDFFKENTYKDSKGETRPCYEITKKGCELIAHKLTGKKGVLFTAAYINRFHEMEKMIHEQPKNIETKIPWFIRKFRGNYIVLQRDFITLTNVDIKKHKLFYRPEYFTGGIDFNSYYWKCDNEKFKSEYGFDYGNDECMMYFYPCGIVKAINILKEDKTVKANEGSYTMLLNGINKISCIENKNTISDDNVFTVRQKYDSKTPIQINILIENDKEMVTV